MPAMTTAQLATLRAQLERQLPSRCTITNVEGDEAFERTDVPCVIRPQPPKVGVIDDGTGTPTEIVIQHWIVTVVAGGSLPSSKARITATVEGVTHTLESIAPVPRGGSNALTVEITCEQVFGG